MEKLPDVLPDHAHELAGQLQQQPYALIDGFLDPSETAWFRQQADERFHAGAFEPAGIGRRIGFQHNATVRSDLISWLDPSHGDSAVFFRKMDPLIQMLNRTCFLGIRAFEAHFAVYPAGSFYRRHLDNFQDSDSRILSVICYLNESWQPEHGGQLRLFLPQPSGGETTLDIAPLGGRLVVFESRAIEHEVLVANHPRYSITGWLRNETTFF